MPIISLSYANTKITDTFVRSSMPSNSYGKELMLEAGTTNSGDKSRALLKFDLGLIPNNVIINEALLVWRVGANSLNTKPLSMHVITSNWDDNVTWNTQPTFENEPFTEHIFSITGSVQFNVTQLVQKWNNGTLLNHGILLKSADEKAVNTRVLIESNEYYEDTHRPTLTINFSFEPPKCTLTSPSDNQTLTENATLNIQGTASDTDKDNVVTIKYRINNGTTRALQSGVSNGSTPISFAKTLTFRAKRLYDGTTDLTGSDLAENTDHTLTIWAEDDQGGKSTEVTRKFRVVHNRPPVINGQNVDLGVLNAIPSKTYTVTEPEGDAFTITEKINGKVIRTFAGTDSKENTATIPLDTWLRLSLTAVHTLTIEATDSKGMTSTRSYTFRRSADKIAFALRNPFGTDIAAKRILVTIDATIPAGADYKAEVCNNAFDELPTWEDASNHVKFNRGFIFTNKEKTAEKWGVSVRFSFTKGTATEPIIVRGFGGAFD